jgi:hypothetical protein
MTFEQFAATVRDWASRLPPARVRKAIKRQLASADGVEGLNSNISVDAALVMVQMGLGPGMVPVAPRRHEPSETAIASEPEAETGVAFTPVSKAVECAPRRELRGRPSKRAQALVREQLAQGPKRGEEVQAAAHAAEISEHALIAAASALGVRTRKGQWWLPG